MPRMWDDRRRQVPFFSHCFLFTSTQHVTVFSLNSEHGERRQEENLCSDVWIYFSNSFSEISYGSLSLSLLYFFGVVLFCIFVEKRVIDVRSEWRTFSSDGRNKDDPSRVGGPEVSLCRYHFIFLESSY